MQPRTLSEVFVLLLGSHKEFVLEDLRRGRPFSHEGEFEVSDNLVDDFMIFYESDDLHLAFIIEQFAIKSAFNY